MKDKFEQWKELCKQTKNQELMTDFTIVSELWILWDTPEEIDTNLRLFFESWWKEIVIAKANYKIVNVL